MLPEFLWIDALAQKFGTKDIHSPFYKLIDQIESYIKDKDIYLIGFLSDFDKVPEDVSSVKHLIQTLENNIPYLQQKSIPDLDLTIYKAL